MPQSLVHNIIHLVFSTKERRPFISNNLRDDLGGYIAGVLRNTECHSIAVGAVSDHIHVLFILSKNKAFKDVVRDIKSNSSRWLAERGKSFEKFQWQAGYSAFSVSQSNVDQIIKYVRDQEEHHKAFDFKDELKKLLAKHGVEFDENYLWD